MRCRWLQVLSLKELPGQGVGWHLNETMMAVGGELSGDHAHIRQNRLPKRAADSRSAGR
jgi:hypothetical protein